MEFADQYLTFTLGTTEIQVRYYGIIIVAAMLVAATVAARLAARRGMNADHIWGALTWAIFPGIIFARLWFILFPPVSLTAGCGSDLPGAVCQDTAWYLQNFFNLNNGAIAIWSGGLSIFGAVLGGLLGAWLYFGPLHNTVGRIFHVIFLPISLLLNIIAWPFGAIYNRIRGKEVEPLQIPRYDSDFPNEGVSLLPWLDIAAVALPLGQFIGRWANFVNQELYGPPTGSSFWGITIASGNRVAPYESMVEYPVDTLFHPLFLYEGLWSLAAFFVLLWLFDRGRRFSLRAGDIFLLYLIQYSFIRFVLEFLRVEVAYIPGTTINSSQVATGAVFLIALIVFIIRRRGAAETAQQPTANASAAR